MLVINLDNIMPETRMKRLDFSEHAANLYIFVF